MKRSKRKALRDLTDRELKNVQGGSAAITAAVIVAGGAAYAANKQRQAQAAAAKAAAAPSSTNMTTTNTSTQTGWDPVQGDLDYARQAARNLYDAGPVLRPGGSAGKGGGGGGGSQDLSGVTVQNGVPGVVGKNNTFQPLGSSAAAKWMASQGGSGGTASGAPARGSNATQLQNAANKLIDAGNAGDPNLGAADKYIGDTLKDPLAGNSVYADLNERLKGANLSGGNNLLGQFLGPNYSADGSAPGGGSPAGGGGTPASGSVWTGNPGGGSGGGGGWNNSGQGGSSGPMITDQSSGPGLYNDWAKAAMAGKYMDPNDPQLQDYLSMIQRQGQSDLDAQQQKVADEFEGVGAYGGSGLALQRALTSTKGNQQISDARTAALMGFRGQGMDVMNQAAAGVNQRDIAGSGLASNERIAEGNRSASSAANAASIASQSQIANRGLDLEGISAYLQNNQFGLSQLAGLGNSVSADKQGAVGLMSGLNQDVRYAGGDKAVGTAAGMADRDLAAQARANAQKQRQQEIDYQNRLAPGQSLDQYLNRLGFFNSAGGTSSTTSHTEGTGTNPAAAAPYLANQGPSPLAAGLMAGAGTYFQGQSNAAAAATKKKGGG